MARKLHKDEPDPFLIEYPWDEWLDGEAWELTQEDVGNTILVHFQANAYVVAKNKGLRLRTRLKDGKLYLQALEGMDE